MRKLTILLPAVAALLGCGGGGSTPVPMGTLTVNLGSDSIPGCSSVVVSLGKLEASGDGSHWVTLFDAINGSAAGASVDLMSLQNGHPQAILPATQVPAGTYTQFRATWGSRNYSDASRTAAYVVAGGAPQALVMPPTTIFNGSLAVSSQGSAARALLMVDGQQAVLTRAGTPGTTYAFNASGELIDQAACGRITGTLSGGTAIAGAEVFAQTVSGTGTATVERRALSDASGAFVLDGLATGALVHFVASAPAGFQAQAGPALTLAPGASSTANLAFTSVAATGTLTLTVTPASTATQGTWGELRQTLATGGTSQNLVVRSLNAVTGASSDTFTFTNLAPGAFGVTAQRSTGGQTPVLNPGNVYAVTAGSPQSVALTF